MRYVVFNEKTQSYLLRAEQIKWVKDIAKASKFSTEENAKHDAIFRDPALELTVRPYLLPVDEKEVALVAKVISNFLKLKNVNLQNMINYYSCLVEEDEKLQQDFLHRLEQGEMSDEEALCFMSRFKKFRSLRREHKNYLHCFKQAGKGLVQMKKLPTHYVPRIDETLFTKKRIYAKKKIENN